MFLFPGLSEKIQDMRKHRQEVPPELRAELRRKTEGIICFLFVLVLPCACVHITCTHWTNFSIIEARRKLVRDRMNIYFKIYVHADNTEHEKPMLMYIVRVSWHHTNPQSVIKFHHRGKSFWKNFVFSQWKETARRGLHSPRTGVLVADQRHDEYLISKISEQAHGPTGIWCGWKQQAKAQGDQQAGRDQQSWFQQVMSPALARRFFSLGGAVQILWPWSGQPVTLHDLFRAGWRN